MYKNDNNYHSINNLLSNVCTFSPDDCNLSTYYLYILYDLYILRAEHDNTVIN
jgi:hypothetical protein